MEKNFTVIDLAKFRHKSQSVVNTVLLLMATLTALVLVVILFIFIKKNLGL